MGIAPRPLEKSSHYTTLNHSTTPYHTCYPPPMPLSRIITALLLPPATARLTTLLTEDQITAPLRELAFRRLDALPPTHPANRAQLSYLITCNRCVSVYAAAALLIAATFPLTRPFIRVLALSQLTLTLLDLVDRILAPPQQPAPDFDLPPEPPDTPLAPPIHGFTPEENPYA